MPDISTTRQALQDLVQPDRLARLEARWGRLVRGWPHDRLWHLVTLQRLAIDQMVLHLQLPRRML